MKNINSPQTFKTSEIAIVKEKLGYPVKKAYNRKNPNKRKVNLNPFHEKFITQAFKFFKSKNINPTYEQIRKKAFEFYQKEKESKLNKYLGIFKTNLSKEEALKIIDDEEIIYE